VRQKIWKDRKHNKGLNLIQLNNYLYEMILKYSFVKQAKQIVKDANILGICKELKTNGRECLSIKMKSRMR